MKYKQRIRIIIFAVIPFFIVFSSSCIISNEYKDNLNLKWQQDHEKYLEKMKVSADQYSSSRATAKEIAGYAQSRSEQEYFIFHQSLIRYFTATILINKKTKALKAADKFAQDSQEKAKLFVIQRVLDNRGAVVGDRQWINNGRWKKIKRKK